MLSLTQPHPQTRPTAPKPFQNATLPAARTALQQVLAVAHRSAPATGAIPTRTARGRFYRQSLGVSRNGGPQSPSLTALFAARGKEPTQIGKPSHTKRPHPQHDRTHVTEPHQKHRRSDQCTVAPPGNHTSLCNEPDGQSALSAYLAAPSWRHHPPPAARRPRPASPPRCPAPARRASCPQ